jgi:hypothetical protein
VEVRFPGRRDWRLLVRPGTETPMSTHLRGAHAWAEDYARRGCKARLVEVDLPRGPSHRSSPEAPAPTANLSLF